MPNNLEAEQALLGCMLIDNEILADVKDEFFRAQAARYNHVGGQARQ